MNYRELSHNERVRAMRRYLPKSRNGDILCVVHLQGHVSPARYIATLWGDRKKDVHSCPNQTT